MSRQIARKSAIPSQSFEPTAVRGGFLPGAYRTRPLAQIISATAEALGVRVHGLALVERIPRRLRRLSESYPGRIEAKAPGDRHGILLARAAYATAFIVARLNRVRPAIICCSAGNVPFRNFPSLPMIRRLPSTLATFLIDSKIPFRTSLDVMQLGAQNIHNICGLIFNLILIIAASWRFQYRPIARSAGANSRFVTAEERCNAAAKL